MELEIILLEIYTCIVNQLEQVALSYFQDTIFHHIYRWVGGWVGGIECLI